MPRTRRHRAESPTTCEHRAAWRAVTLSADGTRRYGICPRCESPVSEAVHEPKAKAAP